jgi:hypothetical protein
MRSLSFYYTIKLKKEEDNMKKYYLLSLLIFVLRALSEKGIFIPPWEW